MASNYFAIAAPRVGRNALIDFSPISNALDDYGRARERDMERARLADAQQYQRGRDAQQDARQATIDERQQVEWFGKQAAAIDRLQGPQRDAAWKGLVARHPNAGSLTPDYLDAGKGPAMVAAEAGIYRDPRQDRLADIELRTAEANLANAQRPKAPERLEVNGRIVERGPNGWQEVYAAPNAGLHEPPAGYQWDPAKPGALRPIAGGPGEFKSFTETQTKDAGFGARMLRAEDNMNNVLKFNPQTKAFEGYDPTVGSNAYFPDQSGLTNLYTANLINSNEWQQYIQGARESMAALLRKDTGAAVTDQEFELYFPMYYPQPGDGPDVVAQKAEARREIAQGLALSSGGAFEKAYPDRAEKLRQGSAPPSPQNLPQPKSAAERDALAPGTVYIAPDGQQRVKQ